MTSVTTLETATAAFLDGYRVARGNDSSEGVDSLLAALLSLEPERRPFAFEGAAMAWRLADDRERRRRSGSGPPDGAEAPGSELELPGVRILALLRETAAVWHPFLELGVGCALAKQDIRPSSDSMIADGYGFQLGLTRGVSTPGLAVWPPRVARGYGRGLWFVTGGDADACAGAIEGRAHLGELWRGVGTACAFAGDPRSHADRLATLSDDDVGSVEAGVATGVDMWLTLGHGVPARTLAVQEAIRLSRAATRPPYEPA